MADEVRREHTEIVQNDAANTDPVTGNVVTTDPVTGEVVSTAPGGATRTTEVTTDYPPQTARSYRAETYTGDPYAARRLQTYKIQQAVYLVFGIIEGLLAIRFVLMALGANPAAGFAQFIYGITAPFMAPFVGLFGEPRLGGSVFEWTALVAIIIYALVAWVIVRLVWLAAGDTRAASVTRTTEINDRLNR